jgi:hypothetical protein
MGDSVDIAVLFWLKVGDSMGDANSVGYFEATAVLSSLGDTVEDSAGYTEGTTVLS